MWAGGSYQARERRIRRFSLTRQSYSGPKPQQISLICCVERLFCGYEKAAAGMERCDGDEGRCNRIRDGKGREEEGEKVQSDRRNFEGALWLVSPCGANGGGVTA